MTIWGTCHFVSERAAIKYYQPYGFTAADVRAKIAANAIRIGVPKTIAGERVVRVDDNLRYGVDDGKP